MVSARARPRMQPFGPDRQPVVADEPRDGDNERARVKLERPIDGGVRPLEARQRRAKSKRAEDHIERHLQPAAPVIGQIRRPMLRRRIAFFRRGGRDGVHGPREPANGRIRVDVAHRDVRRGLDLPHPGAKPRHQQRVRAVLGEEIAVDRDLLDSERLR